MWLNIDIINSEVLWAATSDLRAPYMTCVKRSPFRLSFFVFLDHSELGDHCMLEVQSDAQYDGTPPIICKCYQTVGYDEQLLTF